MGHIRRGTPGRGGAEGARAHADALADSMLGDPQPRRVGAAAAAVPHPVPGAAAAAAARYIAYAVFVGRSAYLELLFCVVCGLRLCSCCKLHIYDIADKSNYYRD